MPKEYFQTNKSKSVSPATWNAPGWRGRKIEKPDISPIELSQRNRRSPKLVIDFLLQVGHVRVHVLPCKCKVDVRIPTFTLPYTVRGNKVVVVYDQGAGRKQHGFYYYWTA